MKKPLPDYYAILGISKTASEEEIKKAYRDLCKTHHPDKGGDPEKMKEINISYDILSNPEKRKQYDDPLTDPQFNPFDQGSNPFNFNGNPFGGINLEDILGNLHGFRFETNFGNQHRTMMLHQQIVVPFLTAIEGGEISVKIHQLGKTIKFNMPALENSTAEFKIRIEGSQNNQILLTLTVHAELPKDLKPSQLAKLKEALSPVVEDESKTSGGAETTTP